MKPPAVAERLLARVLGPSAEADALLGDLHEEYVRAWGRSGRSAGVWYWTHAVRLTARHAAVRCVDRTQSPPHTETR